MTTPPNKIAVQNLTITYPNGHHALKDITVTLDQGGICAIIGVNGSGKSTLLKAISGAIQTPAGTITINDKNLKSAQKLKLLSYVPQSEEIDWNFPVSVYDVVMMGRYGHMGFMRSATQKDKDIVHEALSRVSMTAFAGRQIGELSGGQKKRVFLARALAQQSQIILLDEPFTGVDMTTENDLIALLRDLAAAGSLILISTHDLAKIPQYCSSVIMIRQNLIAAGETAKTFTKENIAKTFGTPLSIFEKESNG